MFSSGGTSKAFWGELLSWLSSLSDWGVLAVHGEWRLALSCSPHLGTSLSCMIQTLFLLFGTGSSRPVSVATMKTFPDI